MGKRGLYPLISKKNSHNNQLKLRMDIISYSDGKKSIFEIANFLNQPLSKVFREYLNLKENNILT